VTHPVAKFDRFLRRRQKFITIDDAVGYKRLRVQLHGMGILLRDQVSGSDIKTKEQQVARAGDLVVAEIDAKVGGFGIVPPDLDGGVVSSHYFLFEVDEEICLRGWLDAYIRAGRVEEQVTARGSTNYAAIRPDRVLDFEIPLPPLPEQRRMVARIDEVEARIEEAKRLSKETRMSTEALLEARFNEITADTRWMSMVEVAPLERRAVQPIPDEHYSELGIRSFGRGTFHKPEVLGFELGDKRVFKIEPGDLLFNVVFAWEGAVAVAQPHDSGRIGSHRFLSCVPRSGLATAEFLRFYFLTEAGLEQLRTASPGGAGRNRTLGLNTLGRISVPVPAYAQQIGFDKLQSQFSKVTCLRAEVDQKLAALLSSVRAQVFN
jgi:type I restriction enzyme S subunit